MNYLSGESVIGTQVTDVVQLAGAVLENQGIGSATRVQGFDDVDGVLGCGATRNLNVNLMLILRDRLGPTDLSIGTLIPDRASSVLTGR